MALNDSNDSDFNGVPWRDKGTERKISNPKITKKVISGFWRTSLGLQVQENSIYSKKLIPIFALWWVHMKIGGHKELFN